MATVRGHHVAVYAVAVYRCAVLLAFIRPKSEARELSMGSADTVISACGARRRVRRAAKLALAAVSAPPCPRASAQNPCSPCGTGGRLTACTRQRDAAGLWCRRGAGAAPDRMTTCSTSLFFTSAKSHEYWRTASAVPWNHSVPPVPGVCVAARTCVAAGARSATCAAAPLARCGAAPPRSRRHRSECRCRSCRCATCGGSAR